MARNRTSQQNCRSISRWRLGRPVAIAALLACSATLDGPTMLAGSPASDTPREQVRAQASRPVQDRPGVLALTGRLSRRPLASLSDQTFELAGLLVLGLTLLGAGRVFRHEPAKRRSGRPLPQNPPVRRTVPEKMAPGRITARTSAR